MMEEFDDSNIVEEKQIEGKYLSTDLIICFSLTFAGFSGVS